MKVISKKVTGFELKDATPHTASKQVVKNDATQKPVGENNVQPELPPLSSGQVSASDSSASPFARVSVENSLFFGAAMASTPNDGIRSLELSVEVVAEGHGFYAGGSLLSFGAAQASRDVPGIRSLEPTNDIISLSLEDVSGILAHSAAMASRDVAIRSLEVNQPGINEAVSVLVGNSLLEHSAAQAGRDFTLRSLS